MMMAAAKAHWLLELLVELLAKQRAKLKKCVVMADDRTTGGGEGTT